MRRNKFKLLIYNRCLRFAVFSVSSYRRRHIESYDSHNLFRIDNVEAFEIRQLSIHEAQEDAMKWLNSTGEIAVSVNK